MAASRKKTSPAPADAAVAKPVKAAARPVVAAAPETAKVAKPLAEPAAKPVAKAGTKSAAKPTDKAKKPKLVRDSFTIPKTEYAVLEALKQRAARAGAPAKKSELLRAGIKVLASMDEAQFLAAMGAVPALKTGRPAKA